MAKCIIQIVEAAIFAKTGLQQSTVVMKRRPDPQILLRKHVCLVQAPANVTSS